MAKKTVAIGGRPNVGKSTFINAIALNCILALGLNTALCSSYKCKFSKVVTSMAIKDDILEGDSYFIAEIKKILRKAEYTEDVPEKITETVWKEEESEYMSIPVENKKKGILRLWQQKEQNIFGRIRKLLQGGKIPEKKVEPFVFEPEPEINMHQQNPTVLLADLPKKEYGILKYEGNGTCSELSIDHTPYIIGSELDCDGVIPSGTVSRHHARITRKGEVYFIEDLNSSNGTMVGGELLNCRVKMSLQAQETVMFADEKFRFI